MSVPAYPFEPKSNAYLQPGQFWGMPLSDGRWACGRVLAVKSESDSYFHGNSRTLLAALMDWEGDEPPTADGIAGHRVVAQGWAHVLTIQKNGGQILGERRRGRKVGSSRSWHCTLVPLSGGGFIHY